jgi:hypothetical protein
MLKNNSLSVPTKTHPLTEFLDVRKQTNKQTIFFTFEKFGLDIGKNVTYL